MYSTILHPLTFFMAGTVLASPTPILKERDTTCGAPVTTTVNALGNLAVHYSDTKVSLGDQDPTTLFQTVGSQCADAGSCDPNPWTAKGQEPGSPSGLEGVDISMVAYGLYPTWIHNGLADALMDALSAAIGKETKSYTPSTTCATSIGCFGSAEENIDVYTIPNWIAVYYYDPNDCNADPAYMGVQTTVQVEGSSGFCSTFGTVGSAVSSTIGAPGGVGAIFSLLGLSCSLAGQ